MKIILPAVLNPISRRKDKSVKLSLDTREVSPEEALSLMALEGSEGWICISPNEADLEVPDEPAQLEGKTPSERLRASLFVYWKQETDAGKYVGTFETFKNDHMEKLITFVKSKLHERN